jgi:adenosylhomocysteine nucleosidase
MALCAEQQIGSRRISMSKLVIIAAAEIEVAPLVRGWRQSRTNAQRHDVDIFENGDAVVAIGGMGPVAGRIAADTAYKHCNGDVRGFLSVGFAGGLNPALKVADIVEPKKIVCAADDTEISNPTGSGTLVSAGAVAGHEQKLMLASKHGAHAVDMEAYSVADVARIYAVPFRAIKVISDELDFPMPPMGRFIDEKGRFQTGSFVIYTAIRPWIWPMVWRLGRNSQRATHALCDRLKQEIGTVKEHGTVSQMTEVSR